MTSIKECLICFCEIEKNQIINCKNPDCNYHYCFECTIRLIDYSKNEKIMPSCTCKEVLPESQIKKLGPEQLLIYQKIIFDYLYINQTEAINEKINHQAIIENIQREKLEFMKSEFSGALALTIEYALQTKMKKISSGNLKKIKSSITKNCFNVFCKGKLETHTTHYVCLLCTTKFCKKCEEKHSVDHTCNKEVLANIEVIKEFVRCPKCDIPVIKSAVEVKAERMNSRGLCFHGHEA